ncbi:MAG: fumarylacetoacetate hydrolase family protein [Chloroflexi bacterium]|nr:fumarylacetoacetate hydrolase family protein [Chloroflexota bacterium]
MKLLTYDAGAGPRAGVLVDDRVVDLSALLGTRETLRDLRALLEWADDAVERVHAALASGRPAPSVPLARVRLRAPVLQPPTVRDFFAYEAHAAHWRQLRGETLPEAWYRLPIFYFSNPLCIAGPDDEVPHPSASDQLDYELELAAVIGREGRDVAEAEALDYIAGFTILCDWSARDLQRDESQVGLGPAKGKDFATSLGPLLITSDELAPYLRDGRLAVRCRLRVNGELWMEGDGGTMHHSWGALIERAAHDSRIVPGDVIGSGTVGGGTVSEARHGRYPQARYLQAGDVVELEVEGIGVLRNRIGPKRRADTDYRYRAPAPADSGGAR